jgi:hypothetical protein
MIVAGIIAALLLVVGIAWLVWPASDEVDLVAEPSEGPKLASEAPKRAESPVSEPVDEIVIDGAEPDAEPGGGGSRRPGAGDETDGSEQLEPETETETDAEVETVSLWFESERSLGTCQVSYAGRTRTANLHLKTRQPEGTLEFSYRCGEHRGRGSIDVKRNRVNGVLFCKNNGAVKLETGRSNEGRCDR